ncbi:hypothetical protein [Streptomyces sp. NPDC003635]
MYEALWGGIDPPRDYSVHNMSWVMSGAGPTSTMEDLNRFSGRLLDGGVVSRASPAEMRRTVPWSPWTARRSSTASVCTS